VDDELCEQADCDRPVVGNVVIHADAYQDPDTGEDVTACEEEHRLCRIHLDVVLAASVIRLDPPPGPRPHLRAVT
jgi:hypothetical protein